MALLEKGNFPQTTVNGKSVSGIDHVLIYFCSAVTVTVKLPCFLLPFSAIAISPLLQTSLNMA